MKTKIYLWSIDGSVDIGGDYKFEGFTRQVEAYFNQFGHLPNKGDMVTADPNSRAFKEMSDVVYVDSFDYKGIEDGFFVIGIALSTLT